MPENDKRAALGGCLKLYLKKHRLRQVTVAEHLEISRQHLAMMISGKTPMPSNYFQKIYDLLLTNGAAQDDLQELLQYYLETKADLPGSFLESSTKLNSIAIELKSYMDNELTLTKCIQIAASTQDYDTAIGSILQTIAEQVAAHHCMIFKYEENYSRLRLLHQYHAPGFETDMKSLEDLRIQPRSEWQRKLRDHEVINVYCPGDEMAELEFGRCLRHYGIQTMIAVGIWFENRLFGFITLNSTRIRKFKKIDEHSLAFAAYIIQILLEHKEYIVEIFRNEYLNGLLVNHSDSPLFLFAPGGHLERVNTAGSELFHQDVNDLDAAEVLAALDRGAGCNPIRQALSDGKRVRQVWTHDRQEYLVSAVPVFDAGPEDPPYIVCTMTRLD